MEKERLKIWLNFYKFIGGTFILGLISLGISYFIETSKLELAYQQFEDEHINKLTKIYMADSIALTERIEYVGFLKYVAINKQRRQSYDSLYSYLKSIKGKIEDKKTEDKANQKIISDKNSSSYSEQIKKAKQKTEIIKELSIKKKNADSIGIKKLEKQLAKNEKESKDLEIKIEEQNKIIDENNKKIQEANLKIYSIDTIAINSIWVDSVFTLNRGETKTFVDIGVAITATKVNNLTNRALININTGNNSETIVYSLGIDRYCIFWKNNVKYKLLVIGITNKNMELYNSTVKLSLKTIK